MLIDEFKASKIECFWFFLPFLIKAGYVQLNREALEELVVNSYRRIHKGYFNDLHLDGRLVKEFYAIILEFEQFLDKKAEEAFP